MPTYRTMKQGLFREGQKTGLGLGGSGRVEILRCVKGLKTGMAEWKIVHKKQKDIENKDFTFHIDIGVGGCAKGPAVKGTFIQPIYNVPLERDITGLYIAKPGEEKPLTADTQIHLWCQVLNKSDRDPAEWYPILHQHRKSLEDMFFQRKNATKKKKDDGSTSITDDNISTDQKLRLLKNNASKAFDRFDADNSGSVDLGEYNKMLRYLELFLLPCDSKRIFYNCDMDDTGELDQDQFEVALYVIMTIQEYQSKAAKMAKDAASKSGAIEDNDDRDENTSMRLEPHEAFESFDNDQDGLLDQLEFNEALRCLGVIESAPKDPLTQEEDLKRLMDQLLEEIPSGLDTQEDETMNDPTRLITFVQFLHGWVTCCNISYEIKCRNVIIQQPKHGLPMKPKDALLKHVASAARRQSELMAHARSQGWEMKRLARIEIERKRRAIEKQSEKENSKARKELALQEKEDRIAAKAARMQKFEAERRLSTYKNNSKMAQKKRVEEELDEKKIILMNRIKEKDLLASRMGWDVIDYSDSKLLDIPSDIYWWKVGKKSKDEDSKDLSSVLLFDLSNNRLEEWPKNEFFFRADKIQVMKLDYNLLTTLPSGLSDCRDLVYLSISQNKLNGNSILGKETPLTHLKKLIYLDLSGNEIEEWPFQNSFQNIPTLEILKLNNNNLNMIPGPECLSSFLKLKTLDLSNNDIIALGSDHGIGLLTSLEVLNLSSNILESLPEDLGCIGSHLLTLNLSNNNLRWLPNTIDQLVGLRYLDISSNQLTTIPRNMNHLKNLVEINGSRNSLAMIPESFGSLISLEIISFQHNNLRTLPDTVGLLTRLQHINVQNNKLKDLPREMGSWILLENLNATSNDIISLPKSSGHCHLLKKLNLGYNKIEILPDTISTLINLEILNVNNNQLNKLTSGIGKVTSLIELNLGSNTNLKKLPRSIGHLGKLKSLNICSCGISKLPNDLVKCTALQSLWLRHNRLEALPIELVEQIPTLANFDVMFNPLTKLPNRWSGLKRESVSGTGYTSRDASEYIARQSRVHPIAVKIWERMMLKHSNWKSPVVEEEEKLKQEKEVVQGKEKQKEMNVIGNNNHNHVIIHTAGAMKSNGKSVYKLPITLTEFMNELQSELGVRWDEHAYHTSIRFYKQARNLCGRAPRYDQLDLNDYENENYAKAMAIRKIEDKVVWSHRDSVRATELHQQAYESQLDSLGLKILNRRLRRDYAERKKRFQYEERIDLINKMDKELYKQEKRSQELNKMKEQKLLIEQQIIKNKMNEKMKIWKLKNPKLKKIPEGGYIVSESMSIDDTSTESNDNDDITDEGDHWFSDENLLMVPQHDDDRSNNHSRGSTRDYNYMGGGMNTERNRMNESANSILFDDYDLSLVNNTPIQLKK